MPLCNQTWVVDVFVCAGLLNECTQVAETHYGDRLVEISFQNVVKIQIHACTDFKSVKYTQLNGAIPAIEIIPPVSTHISGQSNV